MEKERRCWRPIPLLFCAPTAVSTTAWTWATSRKRSTTTTPYLASHLPSRVGGSRDKEHDDLRSRGSGLRGMDDLSAASDSSATGCRRVEQRAALLPLACGAPCTIRALFPICPRLALALHPLAEESTNGANLTNHKPRANEEGTNDPARHDEQLTAKKPQNQYTKNRRTNP